MIDVLKEATAFLNEKGVDQQRLNSERLLCHVLDIDRVDLYLLFDRPLTFDERNSYKQLLRRRANHEPLQYLIGHTGFMSLDFIVTPDVLIPRPETETLVEKVIEDYKNKKNVHILDIGTGSGNIAISLANYLIDAFVTTVDYSNKAIAVARENAFLNEITDKLKFIQVFYSEIFPIRNKDEGFINQIDGEYDIVISNPPYIALDEWPSIPDEVRLYEPRTALCDEGDGLTYFRVISAKCKDMLRPGGKIYFEVGASQGESVQEILRESDYHNIRTLPDLNNIDRIVTGSKR